MTTQTTPDLLNSPLIDERLLADIPPRKKKPDWILKESLISVGAWEPLFHRRRLGGNWAEDEKFYEYEHSEKFVKEILDAGGNLLITAFAKNYHIDEDEFRLKQQLAALCKQHRLRLATYIRGDNLYAEVFPEVVQKEDVLSRNADGKITTYGSQEWRKNLCFHKPKVMEMYQATIRRAVVDLGVDAVFFDGFVVGGMETGDACRCETCRQDFTQFLKLRYGNDPVLCKRRFGHTRWETIEPPGLHAIPSAPSGLVSNPVWQEWISFRCTWTARFARTVAAYIQELNPEVAISVNNGVQAKENLALMVGNDLSMGASVDILVNESGYHPRITPDGRIIQHAREYKLTTGAGCFGWTHVDGYGTTPRKLRLEIAHAAAFNRGRATEYGFAFGCYQDFRRLLDVKKSFAQWLQAHWEHYQDLEEVVEVVVWRERKAMAFSDPISFATAMQVEQLLIEDRIPFTAAQREWPTDARVVVLPNLVGLDDRCCRQVAQFVEGGGGVLVVGSTSSGDGWLRKRSDFGLRSILPENVRIPELSYQQHIAGAGVPIEAGKEIIQDPGAFQHHAVGQGRVVYVSSLVDPGTQAPLFNPDHTFNVSLDLSNWTVPQEAEGLRRAVAWLMRNRPTLRVEAERGVIANYYRQSGTGRFYGHLVNLLDQGVFNPVLRMTVPEHRRIQSVQVVSPDGVDFQRHRWEVTGNHLLVELERLDVYSLIIIQTT